MNEKGDTTERYEDEKKIPLDLNDEHALDEAYQPRYDDAEVRRIRRKIDLRVLPLLTFLYLISFVDRGNIGNAQVAGMSEDLGLSGSQYNLVLTLFFIPYVLFEVPSNVVLKLMNPSWWISIIVTSWGAVVLGQGFVPGFKALAVCRILLGVTEAGFFPAATYLLTIWYCRFELQTRFGVFYGAASLAGAFSGLLAFGLSHMDGVGGLEGWRWIFVMEGIITMVAGLLTPLILSDSPHTAKFLTDQERVLLLNRLAQDTGTSSGKVETNEKFQWKFLRAALLDWKIWFTILVFWGNTVPVYAFIFTAPTIVYSLGSYTAAEAQLLVVPPYVAGTITTILLTRLSDRYRVRWPFIAFPFMFGAIGYIGLLSIPHPELPGLTYAFLFFIPMGMYPAVITIAGWLGGNLAPTSKRAAGIALGISLANAGGLVGSNIFLESEAPRYWTGYGLSLGFVVVAIGSTLVLRFAYKRINAKRDAMTEAEIRAKYSERELLDLGDASPLYRTLRVNSYAWIDRSNMTNGEDSLGV